MSSCLWAGISSSPSISPSVSPSISPSPSPTSYSLIVRHPQTTALSTSSTASVPAFQTITFKSEAERDAYKNEIENYGIETEAPVVFRTDDLRLNDAQFLELAEKDAKADPLLSSQWSLFPKLNDKQGFEGVDIDVIRAWTVVKSAPKVVLYIVDSGVDASQADLQGRLVGSFNALDPSQPATDENGHGTHVASIASAKGDNQVGITGIVPGDIQVVGVKFIGATAEGDTTAALRAFEWIEKDIQSRRDKDSSLHFVISNSWGGGYSRFLEEVFQRLGASGVLLVTSAGNSKTDNDKTGYFPCNFRANANLCVAATDSSDRLAAFSGYGLTMVHIAAPGTQILGLVPPKNNLSGCAGSYCRLNGTSQAVPHVSGVAVLVWAANPALTNLDVHEILLNSVDRLPNLEDKVMSGGRLNAYRAVLLATGQDPSAANRAAVAASGASSGGGCSLHIASSATSRDGDRSVILFFIFALCLIYRRTSNNKL